MHLLAHVPIGLYSLPVQLYIILVASAAVVGASFLLIRISPPQRRAATATGKPVPRALVGALIFASAAYLLFIALVATFGRQQLAALNAGALLFWVFTVPLVPIAHCLVGGMFEVINPFAWAARHLSGGRHLVNADQVLERLGYWPAVVLLFVLVFGEGTPEIVQNPAVIGYAVFIYSALQIAFGILFGERWYRGGEVFTAMTVLASSVAPVALYRDAHGTVRLAVGFDPQRFLPRARAREVLITLLLAGVLADGVRATPFWRVTVGPFAQSAFQNLGHFAGIDAGAAAEITLEVVVTWIAFGLFFWAFVAVASLVSRANDGDPLSRDRLWRMSGVVGPSLIPIALAYLLAHNLTQLLVVGPLTVTARDASITQLGPLTQTQIRDISPSWVWWIQVLSIVAGHVVAVVMAHGRLTTAFDEDEVSKAHAGMSLRQLTASARELAFRADLGWLSAMLLYTATSLWIIAQPITAASG